MCGAGYLILYVLDSGAIVPDPRSRVGNIIQYILVHTSLAGCYILKMIPLAVKIIVRRTINRVRIENHNKNE